MERKIAIWLIVTGAALLALTIVQGVIGDTAFAAPGTLQTRPTLPPARPTVGQQSQPTARPVATQAPAATAVPEPTTAPTAEVAPTAPATPAPPVQTMPATGAPEQANLAALAGLIGFALLITGSVLRALGSRAIGDRE